MRERIWNTKSARSLKRFVVTARNTQLELAMPILGPRPDDILKAVQITPSALAGTRDTLTTDNYP